MKRLCCAGCLALLTLLVGCSSSPYVDGYLYLPRPVTANIPSTQPSQPPPVAAYVSVIGIRVANKKASLPLSIEVRLRMDNNGPETVTFDPHSLDLTTGDLFEFPAPIIESSAPVALAPGDSAIATAYFPFPDGRSYDNLDLRTLQLRWVLHIGDQRIQQVTDFRRAMPRYIYYSDPYYWGPYFYAPGPFIGGVVVFHRR